MSREVVRSPLPLHAFCLRQASQILTSSSSFMVAVLCKPPEPAFSLDVLLSPQSGAIAGPRRSPVLNCHHYKPRRRIHSGAPIAHPPLRSFFVAAILRTSAAGPHLLPSPAESVRHTARRSPVYFVKAFRHLLRFA